MQILTGRTSYSTWYSVQQPQLSFPELWQREQNSYPIVFTPVVISALIYPIEAHWIWGGGWLAQMGFHDFAGSCAIHMVGGISALIGAKQFLDRVSENSRKIKTEKSQKSMHFRDTTWQLVHLVYLSCGLAGMDLTAQLQHAVEQLGSIFVTTTIAPAIATVTCMIFTWVKYGKPDVSMCLNASLAGLVAITAPCDVTDALGAIIIGIVAGLLVVFGVWLLDYVLTCR